MPEAELSLMFLRPLNQLGLRYIVSGSIAAILYGEPRFTNDLDVVVFLRHDDIRRLAEAFPSPDFYVPPAEVIATEITRPEKGLFNVIHVPTGFKADIYTTGRDEFNAWAFRHARKMDFKGEEISVAPLECVIVRKLEYFREGSSDKHLRDIRGMLNVSGEQIDRVALDEWIDRRGVRSQWQMVSS
jgi:hypothetical protein